MRLALHGVLACTLLLATGARPGSAASTVATTMIRCCHAVGSGATMCQAKTGRACQNDGGVDMGPGTCNPNPCGGMATRPRKKRSGTRGTPPCGTFLLKWGVKSGTRNGDLDYPVGVATDGSGNVYVADRDNSRIQKFDANGTFLSAWGSAGSDDGQFNFPNGVATDGSGNVYVADGNNNRIQKFDANGTFLAAWGGAGPDNGQFENPVGLATDGSGNVYVADTGNGRIQKFACP